LCNDIHLNTRVVRADWSEHTGTYLLQIERDGKIVCDQCDILINGTGNLSKWKWPDVSGLDSFKGSLLHSANWEDNLSLEGKTVAVVGTGSSAIQIVPKIQPVVKELIHFMRSTTWISPPCLEDALKNAGAGQCVSADTSLQNQHQYTEEAKEHFRKYPDELLRYRKGLEVQFNKMFEMFLRDSDASRVAQDSMQIEMHRRLGPGNEDLKKRLIPSWPPGCRRITPGIGYLEALVKDNVRLVHRGIARVTPEGVVDDDGVEHKVDVIICATGFDVSFKPSFQLIGMDGFSMEQAFDPEPYAYLGMTVPRFPNYFSINSVRGSWAVGTALNSIEACLNYIVACANRMQREGIRAMEVKMEPIVSLYAHIDEWHKRSVWGADCKR
jgi:cation diffusion facilitator CzcD-associated flavoprotein CzcO